MKIRNLFSVLFSDRSLLATFGLLIMVGTFSPLQAKCLSRQSEVDYYTLSKFNRCTSSELIQGKMKMKNVLQKTKKSKSYKGRTAEKALAELQLYNIQYELAMRAKNQRKI